MKEIIEFIETNLQKEKLEQITTAVIDAYRREDDITLGAAAEALHIGEKKSDRKKLFYSIIKKLHPDRLTTLRLEFNIAVQKSDREKLYGLKKLLDVKAHTASVKQQRFDFDYEETFEPGGGRETGFGFGFDDEDHQDDYSEDEGSFINAVKRELFGNHSFVIDPSDLGQIDGVLNLQEYNLEDIDGIEYCRNVRILNLAGNDIFNIYDLQHLTELEELYASSNRISDISTLGELKSLELLELYGNDIEDISPLLTMENLKFADLRSNPVEDRSPVAVLEERGVIVLL